MPDGTAPARRYAVRRVLLSLAVLSLSAGVLLAVWEGDRRSALEPALPPIDGRASTGTGVPELPLPSATEPTIAVGNLEVQIRSAREQLAKGPLDPEARPRLASLLVTHGEFVGKISDYEAAEELGEAEVDQFPKDPQAYVARAKVRALFHRFDEASADLAKAEALGVHPEDLESSRAALLVARGELDRAVEMLERSNAPPNSGSLGYLGVLYLEVGREDEGTETLAKARAKVRDPAPFPLAALDYHEAEIRERHGQTTRARQLYSRAHRLLPTYAAAAAHLAPYLGTQASVDMLEDVARRSDDPEVLVALAASLRKLSHDDEAERREKAAAARYEDLVKHHEAAFSDHAARFWLGAGKDPERAYQLAQKNLRIRQTSPAYDLALSAALVSKHETEACDIAARGLARPHMDESFRAVAEATSSGRCARAEP